jgi:hypothetical protein
MPFPYRHVAFTQDERIGGPPPTKAPGYAQRQPSNHVTLIRRNSSIAARVRDAWSHSASYSPTGVRQRRTSPSATSATSSGAAKTWRSAVTGAWRRTSWVSAPSLA